MPPEEAKAGSGTPPLPAYAKLAAEIRDQIVSGALKPGDQLPTEPELSSRYNVSRNTAREAMRVLASQGMLRVKRGVSGGLFVTHPAPDEISTSLQANIDLLTAGAQLPVSALVEVREMLEIPAAELAALRRTDEEVAVIRATLFRPDTVDTSLIFTYNRDFHAGLLAAHNPLLTLVAQPVFNILEDRILRDRASGRFWQQVDHDHREILSYVEARDQAGAREATRAHLWNLKSNYPRLDRDNIDA
ncbi:FadR/GntR family transcriptional regulator [Phytoactinopolyspora mesophila]|uniref:GntR family transcriptional regulator n=1 Tax=Phytoactinopolyspora mesophila TaxID=2650750 RepID=A0A7K3MDM0_9ACTN|nr:GntR family transcriptional regulator [Phytoactinopolyspora mesophila]NDL61102.1 GntR family transcriptional regulator [Phytoactinopolyspora mesophila]